MTQEPPYQRQSQEFVNDELDEYHNERQQRDRDRDKDIRDRERELKHQPVPPKPFSNNTRVISPHFNQPVNPTESFPPSRPRPAPRHQMQPQALRQPPRPPPQRHSPPPGRPTSGTREYMHSPPSSDQKMMTPQAPDPNRPVSGSKPPGRFLIF